MLAFVEAMPGKTAHCDAEVGLLDMMLQSIRDVFLSFESFESHFLCHECDRRLSVIALS